MKSMLNKYVFGLLQNKAVTSGGNEFQVRGVATLKARDAAIRLIHVILFNAMTRFFHSA